MLYHERCAKSKGYSVIIGIDEAGRGPLAGPVVVAAVFLKTFKFKNRIDDSKRLSAKQREKAFAEIVKKSIFGIGFISEYLIDTTNIVKSLHLATDTAVAKLFDSLFRKKQKPTLKNTILLLDGRLNCSFPYKTKEIIGGDGLSLSIAAASIVAKISRDKVMQIYDRIYPQYGFCSHKGYGTRGHIQNINLHGLSPVHRKTFCRSIILK